MASMSAIEYRTALTTLGLTQQAAGRWLRVSPKTAQNYAKHGPRGPAAVAVEMRLALEALGRYDPDADGYGWFGMSWEPDGDYVRHESVIAAMKGEAG